MNTERKVKTVRCNSRNYSVKYGYCYNVPPDWSYHIGCNVYNVRIRPDEYNHDFEVVARWNPSPIEHADFIVTEFYEEQPESVNSPYATIADVERMIREAMEKSKKVDDVDYKVYAELIKEVKDNTLPFFLFVDQLKQKYTITKKNP